MSKEESKQVGIDWSGFPKSTQEEVKLRQLFKNRSNCYADADDVIQAMDENCFIETINEWQQENYGLMEIELTHTKRLLASCEKALEERDKQQKGYREEEAEKLIKTTYEETMRAMVDWFIHNKDKNKEEMESAIKSYVYPRLAEKGINFKNK